MTTATTAPRGIPAPAARSVISQRLPGILAGVGGALYAIAGLRITFDGNGCDTTATTVLSPLWCHGGLAGLAGIARLGIAPGRLGRVALDLESTVTLVGFAWVGIGSIIATSDPKGERRDASG